MCGIAAEIALDGRLVGSLRVSKMAELLRHRGPDDGGLYDGGEVALGFRRLAILDLSPRGHQPMASADGAAHVIFNGEIYNYRELRDELSKPWTAGQTSTEQYPNGYPFVTGTDTEVVLAAYQRWGSDCLTRFNGMWAIVIWDESNRNVLLARDRFGVKPLAMKLEGSTLLVASEPKALLKTANTRPQPRLEAVSAFLQLGSAHFGSQTFFEDVTYLAAGHFMQLDLARPELRAEPFWDLDPEPLEDATDSDVIERFRTLLFDSVERRLQADVPVGTCLSGGLDSSMVVGAIGRLRGSQPQFTFSAYYDEPGADERLWIDAVADKWPLTAVRVAPGAAVMWQVLEKLAWHQDEPIGGSGAIAQWAVMQAAHERGVKVLLDGQGADEVFGGYQRYFSVLLAAFARGFAVRELVKAAAGPWGTVERPGRSEWVGLAKEMLPLSVAESFRRRHWARLIDPLLGRDLVDIPLAGDDNLPRKKLHSRLATQLVEDIEYSSLPALLRFEDRMSMAHSIEGRTPFLDYRLVEFAISLPDRFRIREGSMKWLMRAGGADLLPEAVNSRRSKLGFATPELGWMRSSGPRLHEYLVGGCLAERSWIDPDAVRRWIDTAAGWREDEARVAWRLLSVEAWCRVTLS